MNRVLIVAAHPDDEILGCGGTVARLVHEGFSAYSLILGEGVTSRDRKRQRQCRQQDINNLREEVKKANQQIGVEETFMFDFPDNRFDTVPLLEIAKTIEEVKAKIWPEIIYTHHKNDLNIDHQITYRAVLTATRPLVDEVVKQIYSFYVPSSTEWNFPQTFSPDVYVDIRSTLRDKLKAMELYQSELREFPHPRSLKGIKLSASYWGLISGLRYAEPFKLVRMIQR